MVCSSVSPLIAPLAQPSSSTPTTTPTSPHTALCTSDLHPSLVVAPMSHRHSGACGCAEEAKQADALGTSLFASIDQERVWCLNEAEADAGRRCLRQAWHDRNDERARLLSDPDDGEMLLHIPFTAAVHVRSISIMAWGDWRPKKIKLSVHTRRLTISSSAAILTSHAHGIFVCIGLQNVFACPCCCLFLR